MNDVRGLFTYRIPSRGAMWVPDRSTDRKDKIMDVNILVVIGLIALGIAVSYAGEHVGKRIYGHYKEQKQQREVGEDGN